MASIKLHQIELSFDDAVHALVTACEILVAVRNNPELREAIPADPAVVLMGLIATSSIPDGLNPEAAAAMAAEVLKKASAR